MGASGESIRCGKCASEFTIPEGDGFLRNESLAEIISAELDQLDFGRVHDEAKRSCEELDHYLREIECSLTDPLNYIHESISDLKNKVQLKGEELKLEIDEKMEKLLNRLDTYENECKTNQVDTTRIEKEMKMFII